MFTFRPAVRESVGLLVGLVGASGAGKSYSAMRLAAGIAGDKPFAVIDTEAGRAKHYADLFRFDHGDLKPPFSPEAYADAIKAADAAGYPVIVVDSSSHEHAGEGGILDMQEAELQRMAGDDWKRREACKMAAWIKPKMSHKRMVQRLLQVRAHLILCFRAEERIEVVRGADGKMEVVPKKSLTGLGGWIPVCEKTLPYELTVSLLLTPDKPGVPQPIKLQEQHRALFPAGQPITEAAGKALAAWAAGGKAPALPPGPNLAQAPDGPADERPALLAEIKGELAGLDAAGKKRAGAAAFPGLTWAQVEKLPADKLRAGLATIKAGPSAPANGPVSPEAIQAEHLAMENDLIAAPNKAALDAVWMAVETSAAYQQAPAEVRAGLARTKASRLAEITGAA